MRVVTLAVIFLLVAELMLAQPGVVDEPTFWTRIAQTETLLDRAITQPAQRSSAISEIDRLWGEVQQVRLESGTVITVETDWLQVSSLADEAQLEQVSEWIRALRRYGIGPGIAGGAVPPAEAGTIIGPSLADLERLLQEPRFQYEQSTPTPVPTPPPMRPRNNNVPSLAEAQISQGILLALAVVTAAAIVVYLLNTLRIRRRAIPQPALHGDDPTNAVSALERADESQQIDDYRAAIRYLYLATLLYLDERGLIHYHPALTNREHLQQVEDNTAVYPLLRSIISVFERVWYGFSPADEALYQRFRQQVERLQQVEPA